MKRKKNLERFNDGKELSITVNDDKTSIDGDMIIIPQNHWNAKKTVKQEIGDTSNKWVGKLGEWIESDRLKQGASAGKYWWSLPAAIVVGMLIFGVIIYWAIKGISKSRD